MPQIVTLLESGAIELKERTEMHSGWANLKEKDQLKNRGVDAC